MTSFIILSKEIYFSQNDSTYFQIPQKDKVQKERNFDWAEKMSVGGNFAFLASQRYTYIDISPLIGYRLSKMILIGAGPVYTYYNERLGGISYKFDMYGLRMMGRLYFLENFFLQTGWDKLNRSIYVLQNNTLQESRIWIDNVWIGGGIRYPVGAGSYMFSSLLYNLNQNNYSPYPNPFLQVGFIVGF